MIILELVIEVSSCQWWKYLHQLLNKWQQLMETVFGHTLLVSGWFNDTPNPPMMETECQKIIDI